jgi:hypothetical protein
MGKAVSCPHNWESHVPSSLILPMMCFNNGKCQQWVLKHLMDKHKLEWLECYRKALT